MIQATQKGTRLLRVVSSLYLLWHIVVCFLDGVIMTSLFSYSAGILPAAVNVPDIVPLAGHDVTLIGLCILGLVFLAVYFIFGLIIAIQSIRYSMQDSQPKPTLVFAYIQLAVSIMWTIYSIVASDMVLALSGAYSVILLLVILVCIHNSSEDVEGDSDYELRNNRRHGITQTERSCRAYANTLLLLSILKIVIAIAVLLAPSSIVDSPNSWFGQIVFGTPIGIGSVWLVGGVLGIACGVLGKLAIEHKAPYKVFSVFAVVVAALAAVAFVGILTTWLHDHDNTTLFCASIDLIVSMAVLVYSRKVPHITDEDVANSAAAIE